MQKKGVTEDLPFDEVTLCFKVKGKIFALTNIESKPLSFILKCDPDKAITLREQYESVKPGYHMNKKHWNTIVLTGQLNWQEVQDLIRHSYDLVAAKG